MLHKFLWGAVEVDESGKSTQHPANYTCVLGNYYERSVQLFKRPVGLHYCVANNKSDVRVSQ